MPMDRVFDALMTGIGTLALLALKDAVTQIRGMKESVIELNEKIAVIVSRVDSHERRITRLEDT
jgi:hypothetical protein